MDAKRLIPILQVLDGRIMGPGGSDLGPPVSWARRLEMEGADEILFVEQGRGRRLRQAWLTEVARSLFIPFTLEAPFEDEGEVAEALALGADKVVVPARNLKEFKANHLGRTRVTAALEASVTPEDGWRIALETMADLAQAGAGEILVTAKAGDLGDLCAQAAHLPMPVILRCGDPEAAAEALVQGADGIAFPAALSTAAAFKDRLAEAGIPLRR